MANVIKYQEEWAVSLQERLKKPTNWKETCDVTYSDSQVFVIPYVGTASESAIQTGLTRGNTYTFQDITQTTETLTIATYDILAELIDRADEAQSNYAQRMNRARLQGDKVNERLEAIVLGQHALLTDLGDTGGGVIGLGAGAITITESNVDNLVRGIIEQIYTANGFTQYRRDGGFVEWRPQDWTAMTTFMQANGWNLADQALKQGGEIGIDYMGLKHYVSTSHAAGHVFAGVRKVFRIGVLKSTYGQTYITEDPAGSGGGNISGISVNTRLDYGVKVPAVLKPLVFDVNVV
jgi:hypothetical protein